MAEASLNPIELSNALVDQLHQSKLLERLLTVDVINQLNKLLTKDDELLVSNEQIMKIEEVLIMFLIDTLIDRIGSEDYVIAFFAQLQQNPANATEIIRETLGDLIDTDFQNVVSAKFCDQYLPLIEKINL